VVITPFTLSGAMAPVTIAGALVQQHAEFLVATGLDYSEAAPVIGSRIGAAGEALNVHLEVAQQ